MEEYSGFRDTHAPSKVVERVEMIAVTVMALCALQADFRRPEDVVTAMDAYYQSQFADLELAKAGIFGTSRVESSEIGHHRRQGGDPGYRSEAWVTTVSLFGCRGESLKAATLSNRYRRLPNGTSAVEPEDFPKIDEGVLASAVKRFASTKAKPLVIRKKDVFVEIRPVRLSKRECLSCHSWAKVGDPVALMLYVVSPKKKAAGPLP